MRWLFRLIDWVRGPAIFRLVWHLLTSVSPPDGCGGRRRVLGPGRGFDPIRPGPSRGGPGPGSAFQAEQEEGLLSMVYDYVSS